MKESSVKYSTAPKEDTLTEGPLYAALEARIATLTEGLHTAHVSEKGIDIVKEIKELHQLLYALRQGTAESLAQTESPRVVVVWDDPKVLT